MKPRAAVRAAEQRPLRIIVSQNKRGIKTGSPTSATANKPCGKIYNMITVILHANRHWALRTNDNTLLKNIQIKFHHILCAIRRHDPKDKEAQRADINMELLLDHVKESLPQG